MSTEESKTNGKVSKGDIVRVDFNGYVHDNGELFDTTNAETAKEHDVFNEKVQYGPIPVLIGGGRIFPGLDEALENAEVGEKKEAVIPPEKAAGQRDPKLVEMVPLREFQKQDVQPRVGMEVNVKNKVGVITAVTAGRVRVDFNRRLAGKTLRYDFTIISRVEGSEDKAKAIIEMDYGTSEGFNVTVDGDIISMVLPDVCKYDQKWLMAKYKVVADLREAMKAGNVRFIEEYVKREEPKEEPKEEKAEEELAPEEILEEKQ